MSKEPAADPLAHVLGLNPQMLEPQFISRCAQGVKADEPPFKKRGISLVREDKLRRDRELVAPSFHPIRRISPVCFRRPGDRTESSGIRWLRSDDLQKVLGK